MLHTCETQSGDKKVNAILWRSGLYVVHHADSKEIHIVNATRQLYLSFASAVRQPRITDKSWARCQMLDQDSHGTPYSGKTSEAQKLRIQKFRDPA